MSQATTLGIAVTAASLLVMPALGLAKRRLEDTLGSRATAGEGVQNLLCAAQAGAVLLGLGATKFLGGAGSIPRSRCYWQPGPPVKASGPGAAKTAASC